MANISRWIFERNGNAVASLLFAVSPVDPLTYSMVSLMLVAATVLASYVPARRATAVDPINALRSE